MGFGPEPQPQEEPGEPLASAVTETATQYRLSRVTFAGGQLIAIEVELLSAGGAVVKTVTFRDTPEAVGFTPAQLGAIKAVIVNYLKGKGTVN